MTQQHISGEAAAARLNQKVQLVHPVIPGRAGFQYDAEQRYISGSVITERHDRADGKTITACCGPYNVPGRPDTFPVPADGIIDEAQLVRWAFGLVEAWYMHEAAETFHLDGVRVFDPHRLPEPRE